MLVWKLIWGRTGLKARVIYVYESMGQASKVQLNPFRKKNIAETLKATTGKQEEREEKIGKSQIFHFAVLLFIIFYGYRYLTFVFRVILFFFFSFVGFDSMWI